MKPKHTPDRLIHAGYHFVVDGRGFPCLAAVFAEAKARGYTGSKSTLLVRLKQGMTTWAELTVPPKTNPGDQKGRRQRERDEVAAAIAAVDARKKEIEGR